eukprot:m.206682 g.206682  ORF g.206682 m.206682 type:complete len:1530 (+) comp17779_c1_seq5:1110-5699(+)
MGGAFGKTSKALTYEEALKLFTPEELQHIKREFERCSNGTIERAALSRLVLTDFTPRAFHEAFYRAFDPNKRGITLRNLVCGLAAFTRGSQEDRIRLLFTMYDVSGAGSVARTSLGAYLLTSERQTLPADLDRYCDLDNGKAMSLPAFAELIMRNPKLSCLVEFVLDPRFPVLDQSLVPTHAQIIASVTHCKETDIPSLEYRFWALRRHGAVDAAALQAACAPQLTPKVAARLAKVMDRLKTGATDFRDYCECVSLIVRGTPQQRLNLCFNMYQEDGLMSEENLYAMFVELKELQAKTPGPTKLRLDSESVSALNNSSSTDVQDGTSAAKAAVASTNSSPERDGRLEIRLSLDETTPIEDLELRAAAKEVLAQASNPAGGLSAEQFVTHCADSHWVVFLLDTLKLVAHLALGLRPATIAEEAEAVYAQMMHDTAQGTLRKAGTTAYIVATSWWRSWQAYVNDSRVSARGSDYDAVAVATAAALAASYGGVAAAAAAGPTASGGGSGAPTQVLGGPPGRITNAPLFRAPSTFERLVSSSRFGERLRPALSRPRDYVVLSERLWQALHLWYGADSILPRPLLLNSETKNVEPELYPLTLHVVRHVPNSQARAANANSRSPNVSFFFATECSRAQSIHELARYICQQQRTMSKGRPQLKLDAMRLWDYRTPEHPKLLEDDKQTIEAAGLVDGQDILLEVRNEDMSWPSELFILAQSKNKLANVQTSIDASRLPGTTGLSNLGNTCFMNSTLQCLSNVPPMTEYFRRRCHSAEINKTNPLGMNGVIATRYGELLRELWSGKASVAPLKLRAAIQKYAPHFGGHMQHDSQEWLAFLLDGIHEDLNRVTSKPYVESKDSDGRPDAEVAAERWQDHLRRNQSIMVDLFHGQLKSQLRCLTCQHVSVTFDPFTFLTLPLPAEASSNVDIKLQRQDGQPPTHYVVKVDHDPTYGDLKAALSRLSGLPENRLKFLDIQSCMVQRVPDESMKLRALSGFMLVAYEIAPPPVQDHEHLESSPIRQAGAVHRMSMASPALLTSDSTEPSPEKPWNSGVAGSDAAGSLSTPAAAATTVITGGAVSSAAAGLAPISGPMSPVTGGVGTLDGPTTASAAASAASVLASPTSSQQQQPQQYAPPPAPAVPLVDPLLGNIICIQRRLARQEPYFYTMPYRTTVFSCPLLVAHTENMTRRDLYNSVWLQVRRFVNNETKTLVDQSKAYPFSLTFTDPTGTFCATCPWQQLCLGCVVAKDDTPLLIPPSSLVAIDWDVKASFLSYESLEETRIVEHSSVEEYRKEAEAPIDIEQCIEAFTKEEELGKDEQWFCARCKSCQPAVKKMDIWSLPPYLIVHFKRFQNVNGCWIKANKRVNFPITDFDPYRFTAHKHIFSAERSKSNHLEPMAAADAAANGGAASSALAAVGMNDPHSAFFKDPTAARKYNLIAVSNHVGILHGGHYVAYANNHASKKWYYFNDSSCKECSVDAVTKDNTYAYMLFYEADGLDLDKFLPKRTTLAVANGEEEDAGSNAGSEADADQKSLCRVQ